MPSGGARTRSGPPPDPMALRLNGEWLTLPASGRQGPTPAFPLANATERELMFWSDMWTRPQAIMWEQARQEEEVALYVRALAEAELPHAPVSRATLVKQLGDSLGISTPGMRANRWKIAAAEELPQGVTSARPISRSSARNRFTVVQPPEDNADGDSQAV